MCEDADDVREFIRRTGYVWTFVVDRDGTLTNRYFTSGIPGHVFIDDEGIIQAMHVGDLQAGPMEELLSKVIR